MAGIKNFSEFLIIGGFTSSILTPIFKDCELKGQFGIANARSQEATYLYKDVVIKAYKESKDSYESIFLIHSKLDIMAKQEEATKEALFHAKERYYMGYSAYLVVADAQ